MQAKQPASAGTTDTQQAPQTQPEPTKKPAIRVRTHVRAGDQLFDSQNSDIRLKTGVETLQGVLDKLARIQIDPSE